MNKTAVVSMVIGDYKEMSNMTLPLIKSYADKTKSDFILINQERIKLKDVGFEKYQLGEIIDNYDRILYLDVDLIVKPDCPNMFDVFNEYNNFYVFVEDQYWFVNPIVNRQESIKKSQEILGNIGWLYGYFNSGVMLFSKRHKELFKVPEKYVVDMRDQTQLNYDCKRLGIWVNDIGLRYNKMDFMNPQDRFDAHIIHYAGKGFTDKWNDLSGRLIQMKNDLQYLTGNSNLNKILPVKENTAKPGTKNQILFQNKD